MVLKSLEQLNQIVAKLLQAMVKELWSDTKERVAGCQIFYTEKNQTAVRAVRAPPYLSKVVKSHQNKRISKPLSEVARKRDGPLPKSLNSDKNLSPNIRYIVAILRFVAIYALFGQKKCLFGSKTVFLGQEVHYYIVYIAYHAELKLQICV